MRKRFQSTRKWLRLGAERTSVASAGVAKGAHETEGLETCWEDAQHLGTFHPSSPAEVKSYVRNPFNFSWLHLFPLSLPVPRGSLKLKTSIEGTQEYLLHGVLTKIKWAKAHSQFYHKTS